MRYYNTIAPSYNELYEAEQLEKVALIKDILSSNKDFELTGDSMVFDVGCGTGISTDCTVHPRAGLDPSIELLRIANSEREKNIAAELENNTESDVILTHYGYIQGLAEAIPIKDKAVNLVLAVTSIHNFVDYNKGLHEINRIAKDRVIITVLKRTNRFEEIILKIKSIFHVIKTIENQYDLVLFLQTKK